MHALAALEKSRDDYGAASGQTKHELLVRLQRADFRRAGDVLRLHELLCWLRAYPDDAQVLRRVERMLAGFARRKDSAAASSRPGGQWHCRHRNQLSLLLVYSALVGAALARTAPAESRRSRGTQKTACGPAEAPEPD